MSTVATAEAVDLRSRLAIRELKPIGGGMFVHARYHIVVTQPDGTEAHVPGSNRYSKAAAEMRLAQLMGCAQCLEDCLNDPKRRRPGHYPSAMCEAGKPFHCSCIRCTGGAQ